MQEPRQLNSGGGAKVVLHFRRVSRRGIGELSEHFLSSPGTFMNIFARGTSPFVYNPKNLFPGPYERVRSPPGYLRFPTLLQFLHRKTTLGGIFGGLPTLIFAFPDGANNT